MPMPCPGSFYESLLPLRSSLPIHPTKAFTSPPIARTVRSLPHRCLAHFVFAPSGKSSPTGFCARLPAAMIPSSTSRNGLESKLAGAEPNRARCKSLGPMNNASDAQLFFLCHCRRAHRPLPPRRSPRHSSSPRHSRSAPESRAARSPSARIPPWLSHGSNMRRAIPVRARPSAGTSRPARLAVPPRAC